MADNYKLANGVTNDTTDVTVVPVPSTGQNIVRSVTVYNADTTDATFILKVDDNGTERILFRQTLATTETAIYDDVINLGTSDQKLEIVLTGAVSANQLQFTASYLEASEDDDAFDINGLTVDTDPDITSDKLITYDDSASAHKAILLSKARKLYGASATQGTTQSLASNTTTKVVLDTAVYNPQSDFDTATNYRYTVSVAGYYLITAGMKFEDASSSGYYALLIRKNGDVNSIITDRIRNQSGSAIVEVHLRVAAVELLSASDYIELFGYQFTGANRDMHTSYMQITLIGVA